MSRISHPSHSLFVTVGTTEFQNLIDQVLSLSFLTLCHDLHIDQVTVQYGKSNVETDNFMTSNVTPNISTFAYAPSLTPYESSASIIISHGGAGTLFECLYLRKCLIAVVNRDLMDDHQKELVEALEARGHLYACWELDDLPNVLERAVNGTHKLRALDPPKTERFARIVRDELRIAELKKER